MEAVNFLNSISTALIGIVSVGGIFTGIYYALEMIRAEDEADIKNSRKKIMRTIKGVVIGLTVSGLIRYILGRL